jgi:hypothetical protein
MDLAYLPLGTYSSNLCKGRSRRQHARLLKIISNLLLVVLREQRTEGEHWTRSQALAQNGGKDDLRTSQSICANNALNKIVRSLVRLDAGSWQG